MTKKEIVDKVSKQTGIDREDVYLLFESFIKTIQDSMVDGKNIYIRGFGSFINKKKEKKLPEIFLQIQLLLLNHIIIPHLNHQKFLAIKLKKL